MKTIRVFEAFAGYGSQAMALKKLQHDYPDLVRFEFVGISEIDRYAITAHRAVHGDVPNLGDISKINWGGQHIDFNLFTYSFPCQDISAAGLQRGFCEGSGSRSSLLWECRRAIDAKRPKYLLMENVKALMQKKFAPDFLRWRQWLESRGYSNYYAVLNAKDYGVPQSRQRVFMVSFLDDLNYEFPKPFPLERRLKHILEPEVDEKYYLSNSTVESILRHCERKIAEGCGFRPNFVDCEAIAGSLTTLYGSRPTDTYILEPKIIGYTRDSKGAVTSYHLKEVANTIHTKTGRSGNTSQYVLEPCIIQRPHGFNSGGVFEIAPALTTSGWQDNNYLLVGYRIRKLTPRECFRLMDVPEDYINRILSAGISNSQLYKLAGNSIVVSCLYHIFKQMFITPRTHKPATIQLSLF